MRMFIVTKMPCRVSPHGVCNIKDFYYAASGDAEGLAEGPGAAALSRVVLMAFKSTMEVYLLSSE